MKTIKFRIWDVERKLMLDWENIWYSMVKVPKGTVDDQTADVDLPFLTFTILAPDDKYIVQQFTGLKDKNGKEIYEGDIVKQEFTEESDPNSIVTRWYWSKYLWTVVYDEIKHCFGVQRQDLPFTESLPHCRGQDPHIEVVGNIYEH